MVWVRASPLTAFPTTQHKQERSMPCEILFTDEQMCNGGNRQRSPSNGYRDTRTLPSTVVDGGHNSRIPVLSLMMLKSLRSALIPHRITVWGAGWSAVTASFTSMW